MNGTISYGNLRLLNWRQSWVMSGIRYEVAAATLEISRDVFMRFMPGEISRDEAITSGKIGVVGDRAKALPFFTCFDPPGEKIYPMVVR